MEIIKRQLYIDKIDRYLGQERIILLTGQRRVGKSFMLKQLRDIKSEEPDTNIIFIDKEKRLFDAIRDYHDLNEYIASRWREGQHNYIMIDEVQEINEFERSLRSFYSEPQTDVIVTGSNAKMLNSELTTLIGGRYKEIYIQPLSYTEFQLFHKLSDSDDTLMQYINYGGLPGLIRTGLDEEAVRDYQGDIFNTVLLKDVIMRNNIRNSTFLEKLCRFLADNEGKLISANNISKYMRSRGENVTPSAIINYERCLCEAYMIHRVERFDIHGKQLLESNEKFYFEDNGIRNAVAGGRRDNDIEKVIESIIYQHLVRMGYKVNVGQLQAGEVDFVCTRHNATEAYVQASYLIASEETRKREFGNLQRIGNNYPKYVISMTPLVDRTDYEGITHLHLRRFLSEGLG